MERKDGKQEDQRRALALRMTKAESGLALVTRKITPLALYHLVLLQASSSMVFPVIIRFDYKKVGGEGLRSCKKTFGNCGVDFAKHHRYGVQSIVLLCFAEIYWFIQMVSPVKYSLMLGMDELLASVLVTHLDVTLLCLFLPNSAGGIKGRDFSFYTTSTNEPCSPAKQFPGLCLAP